MSDLQKLTNPKAREFYTRSMALKEGKFAIRAGTPEFSAWEMYFERLGWTPVAFRMARADPNREATMPTQWPQWFDSSAA